jgi:transposase-like protein
MVKASLRALAKRYGITPKTVAKWKKRETVADQPTDPGEPRFTVVSAEDEAMIVAFRWHAGASVTDVVMNHAV